MTTVRDQSDAVVKMSRVWVMVDALMAGTQGMRDAGEAYLPRWPNEELTDHAQRLAVATLYPAYSRTVEILAAKPFSKPVSLSDDTPALIQDYAQNIDLEGRNLHAFAADTLTDTIAYGLSGVLVEYPKIEGVQTLEQERAAGARPYFVRYKHGQILGWRTQKVAGVVKLAQLRLLESVEEANGEFGLDSVEQVRVLEPGMWRTYRRVPGRKDEWSMHDEGMTSLSEIPFVFFYGKRSGFGLGEPPLQELAFQNVEHWQSKSDQQNILHVARVPILTIIGADDASITVGAASAVKLPQNADMKFIEHSGAAIGAGRDDLKDLEDRMVQAGAEMLVRKAGAPITARQVDGETEGNRCALQRIAEDFEDAMDQCLQYMADWIGEPDGGSISLHKDFGADGLGEASAKLVVEMGVAGMLSKRTVLVEQKRRGVLSDDIDVDTELDAVGNEGPALGGIEDAA